MMINLRQAGNNILVFVRKLPLKRLLGRLLLIAVLVLAGSTAYFFYKYEQLTLNSRESAAVKNEAGQLSEKVGKLILLPSGEIPTVATVTDFTKLKSQEFFKNAKNGDKLLIFAGSKLAILYNPEKNLIINAGPVNFNNQETLSVKISLRNGTATAGLTGKIESLLKQSIPGTVIVSKDQDKNTGYESTLVIPAGDSLKETAGRIATVISGTVSPLPDGEIFPTGAEILIITGKDKI